MQIFNYDNYKKFIIDKIKTYPKKGYGYFTKMAQHLSVTTVLISQIFKGNKNLTPEQAFSLAEFLALSDIEQDYFVLLVERERAGTTNLQRYYSKKINALKENSQNIKNLIPIKKELSDLARAEFYSHWYYLAIWLATSQTPSPSIDELSRNFGLEAKQVNKVISFLLSNGLIEKSKAGYKIGPTFIHLDSTSLHVARHHTNWRIKALQQIDKVSDEELCFTMPCALSVKDFQKIRSEIAQLIKKTTEIIEPSESEVLAFLNIDWFKIKTANLSI